MWAASTAIFSRVCAGATRLEHARKIVAHPATQIVLLALAFYAVRAVVARWPAMLPHAAYMRPVMFTSALTALRPLLSLAFCAAIAFAVMRRGLSWKDPELARLRLCVASSTLALAWAYTTYPFNHYAGQAHLVDRALLLTCALAVLVHPAALPVFLWLLTIVIGQFSVPFFYSTADIGLVVDAVALFVAVVALRALGFVNGRGALAALLVLVGVHYAEAAAAKIRRSPHGYEWVFDNDIGNLLVSSHLNGWLPDVSNATIVDVAQRISSVAPAMQLLTLLLEAATLLLLLSRRLSIVVLALMIATHIGILAASGIFFWKWIVLDAAIIVTLLRDRSPFRSRWVVVLALPLFLLAGEVGLAKGLGWFDTRISQSHELWAVTPSGKRFRIDELDFAPFDKTMAQDRFSFLHDKKMVTTTLGATYSHQRFERIQSLRNEAKVRRYIDRGRAELNEAKAKRFTRFVQRVVSSRNRRRHDPLLHVLRVISSPMHIHHRAPEALRLPARAKVKTVEVVFVEAWFDGERVVELSRQTVREIPISDKQPAKRATGRPRR